MEVINYPNALLNRVKAKYGLESEYKLARKLNVPDRTLRNWRQGRCFMSWDMAFKLADIIGESDQNVVYGLIEGKIKNPRVIRILEENAP